MPTRGNPLLHNPHLEGDSFFWQGGKTGVWLSHGFTATTAEVRPLAERLLAGGYTVAAPLLPGHGTSPQDLNRVHWQDWVQAGQETLETLQKHCERVFLSGESMGGALALYLASQNPSVAGLVLYAPAIALQLSLADYAKLYLGALLMEEAPRSGLDSAEVWQGYPGLPLKGAVQLLALQRATRARLGKIHQPVLVFQGRLDTTVAENAGQLILQNISSSHKEQIWLEKSHHTLTLDVELDFLTQKTMQWMSSFPAHPS